jgi:hypothetical protein
MCTYAHRMQHTRGHAPVLDVLHAAGVDVARKTTRVRLPRGSSESGSSSSESEHEHLKRMAGIPLGGKPHRPTVVVPSLSHHRDSVGWQSTESNVFVHAN